MDAQRVEILHRSDGEAVVVGVAYHLKLYLFPAFQRLFYQNLGGEGEGTFGQFHKFLLVGADAGTQTAKGVG